MAGEVDKLSIAERAGAATGLDHHHLVAVLGVNVAVDDVADIYVGSILEFLRRCVASATAVRG